jgi:hypothetical protein
VANSESTRCGVHSRTLLLGHQLLHRVLDQIRIPIIAEVGGELAEDPSWHALSRQKSYATKQQPFSIYCEKSPLGVRQEKESVRAEGVQCRS